MSTLVVYSDTTGYIDSSGQGSSQYLPARAGTGNQGFTVNTIGGLIVGQDVVAGINYFSVWETFLTFDTSTVGSGSVSAAVLNLTSQGDNSTTNFTVEARLSDWGTGLTGADWIAGASLSALTLLAHHDTASGFVANTAYDFTDDAFPANVNKTGSTRFLLSSSRTISAAAPTGQEYVVLYGVDEAGTTRDPKLTVTYAAGGGTLFLMLEDNSGSYELEDGSGGTKLEN